MDFHRKSIFKILKIDTGNFLRNSFIMFTHIDCFSSSSQIRILNMHTQKMDIIQYALQSLLCLEMRFSIQVF